MSQGPVDPAVAARIQRFRDLKERFPAKAEPRWSLATALADAHLLEEAADELEALVRLQPDYCMAFLKLGSVLAELERWSDAAAALESAHRLAVEQGHMAPKQEAEMLLAEVREELEG